MATVKVVDWERKDGVLGLDENNPNSRVTDRGELLNARIFSVIEVELEVDNEPYSVSIESPYSRQKVITEVQNKILTQTKKTDKGVTFEVVPAAPGGG